MLDYELELGLDGEYEADFESYDGEYESEEFLGDLLRKVAPTAIKAIGGLMEEYEFETEDEFEFEDEFEDEFESEFESYPTSEYEALMEQLGDAAATSQTEAEAEAFIGALLPLAAKALPIAAKFLPKVASTLLPAASRLASSLFRSKKKRPLVRTMPRIMRGTMQSLARQASRGRPVSGRTALNAFRNQTRRVLYNPRVAAAAIRRNRSYRRRPQSAAYRYAYR